MRDTTLDLFESLEEGSYANAHGDTDGLGDKRGEGDKETDKDKYRRTDKKGEDTMEEESSVDKDHSNKLDSDKMSTDSKEDYGHISEEARFLEWEGK